MEIKHKKGIIFKEKEELFVDAFGIKNKKALITHAHTDHAKATKSNTYYMTKETAALIKAKEKGIETKETKIGEKFEIGEFYCTLHNSGHILGSTQLQIENSTNIVFTSDFKLEDSIILKGAEIIPTETLIIETTFGSPEYVFPKREQVYEQIMLWANKAIANNNFVILGGYSTGKAQELTKFCNEFLGETPIVHEKIYEQNKVYENQGINLGEYIKLDNNLKQGNILIYPPHLINDHMIFALKHQLQKKVEVAITTGWIYTTKYKTFPLSDHADFNSLLKYVKESEPKIVLTTHGFEEEFAHAIRKKLGINAKPLSKAEQKTLQEF
ncbi:MAG: MBL fold metallo-hydrolase RNA specificity domain-containing protein [Candidatus Diapherotrites archaeon]